MIFLAFREAAFVAGEIHFLEKNMTRVAVISVIVENISENGKSIEELNEILHGYGEFIIGRMGIPYKARNVGIISVSIDAPQDTISTLSGVIGKLPGVSVKTALSGVASDE